MIKHLVIAALVFGTLGFLAPSPVLAQPSVTTVNQNFNPGQINRVIDACAINPRSRSCGGQNTHPTQHPTTRPSAGVGGQRRPR